MNAAPGKFGEVGEVGAIACEGEEGGVGEAGEREGEEVGDVVASAERLREVGGGEDVAAFDWSGTSCRVYNISLAREGKRIEKKKKR